MIPLTTERLRLRAFAPGDLEFVRRLPANPDLVRFIPSATTPDEATARRRLGRFMSLVDHPVQGFSLIELRDGGGGGGRTAPGTAVGLVLVKPIPSSDGAEASVLEIGWRQVAEHCGHGYVVAVTDPENLASQRVAERIGMERLGLSRDFYDARLVLFRSFGASRGTGWLPAGWELLDVGEYAFPGPSRDRLVAAVLAGGKRTTTALLAEYETGSDPLPAPGRRELVVDSAGTPVCVTEDVAVDVVRLGEVTLEHAVAEGEGYTDLVGWRAAHERFWTGPDYRGWFTVRGTEPPAVNDDTLVVCTRFEVVARRPGREGGR